MTPNEIEDLSKVTRALSSPYRVAIIKTLGEQGELNVKDIGTKNVLKSLSPSAVSQHVRQLLDAGVVTCRHDHPRVFYSVDENRLAQAKSLFAKL